VNGHCNGTSPPSKFVDQKIKITSETMFVDICQHKHLKSRQQKKTIPKWNFTKRGATTKHSTRTKPLPTIIATDGNINIITKSRSNADANGNVDDTSASWCKRNIYPGNCASNHSYFTPQLYKTKWSPEQKQLWAHSYTFEETSIVEKSQLRDMDHWKDIKMSVLATLLQEDSPLPSESTASTF
jgi:hypothetical protein